MASLSFDEEMMDAIACIGDKIGLAITASASPGEDATGGHVGSLTEAVMGTTAGLVRIADAISDLAGAIRELKD